MAARSLWLEEALRGTADAPRLEGEERADVCVVGGGYTGLWAALALKEHEPSLDVALVEADVCGGGASGRNGGFVMSWWNKFMTLEKLCGREEALALAAASAEAVSELGSFCVTNGLAAHFRHDGWLWTATSEAQIGAWDAVVAACEQAGVRPFEALEPALNVIDVLARERRFQLRDHAVHEHAGEQPDLLDDDQPAGHRPPLDGGRPGLQRIDGWRASAAACVGLASA